MTVPLQDPYPLTPAQTESFHTNGYLLLDDALDTSSIQDVQTWTAEVKGWPDRPGQHMPYQEERSDGTVGLCRTENYANYHEGFASLFRGQRLTGILGSLMGEEAVLFKEKINYKEAGGSGGFDAHIDATAYTHAGAVNHLTFLLAVNDMDMKNGCLEVVPGSHKQVIPLGDNMCIAKEWEASQTWVPVPCKAGTLLVFGSYLAHRSGPNSSPKPRAAIYATYNGISEGDKHDSYYAHRRQAWPPTSERIEGKDYTEGAITYAFGSPMTGGKTAIDSFNRKRSDVKSKVDDLFDLIKAQGDRGYIGEDVSQLEHSLQVAHQARHAGADEETVIAALLHDIGQFLPRDQASDLMHNGISVGKRSHDAVGEAYLRGLGFPDKVCRLVGGHVLAKRYLTAVSPEYHDKLSNASKASLKHQGGPFDEQEVQEFEKLQCHKDIVALRLWDDKAKDQESQPDGLDTYKDMAVRVLAVCSVIYNNIMPDLGFVLTSFGPQNAPKKCLLLHGLMGTGAVFFKVAERLTKDGYRVDCPDLLGHGWAAHTPPYAIETLARHLADNLNESYDVIGGVSFGSTIAAALYPLLSHKPERLVLAEPLLDHPAFQQSHVDGAVATTKDIPTEEAILKNNPNWIPAEATLRRMSLTQIDPEVIRQLFQAVNDGGLPHTLLPSAETSQGTEIIILAGDPDLRSVYPTSNASKLEKEYPHVKFGQRPGASHDMHKTDPDVLHGVIVHGLNTAEALGIQVLRS